MQLFKSFFGWNTEENAEVLKELKSLSIEKIQERLAEERGRLVREYELLAKPRNLSFGLAGLKNLGNTCFMNSALQCLMHTPPLTRYLLAESWEQSLNPLSSPARGRLVCEYYQLLAHFWSEKGGPLSPASIRKTMTRVAKSFAGYSQQDSQEFLQYFLDAIHEDLNRVVRKPYEAVKDYSGQPISEYARELFEMHLRRNDSFVVSAFHGQYYSYLQCPDCGFESVACDPFEMVSLNIPSTEAKTYEGYLAFLTYEQKINNVFAKCTESLHLSQLYSHIEENAQGVSKRFFRGFYYLRSRITEAVRQPESVMISTALDNQGYLFFCQVFDPRVHELVFGPRACPFVDNDAEAFWLRIVVQDHQKNLIAIEKEVQVPQCTTSFDVHLLVYLIHRKAIRDAKVKGGPVIGEEPIGSLQELEAEFRAFWPSDAVSSKQALFLVSVGGQKVGELDRTASIFQHTFEHVVSVEVTISPEKLAGPLQLKRCSELRLPPLAPQMPPPTLERCFESFESREQLDKENMWFCSRCKAQRQAYKKMGLHRLPDVLIVHLKRFKKVYSEFGSTAYTNYRKNNSLVRFPTQGLDLTRFLVDSDEQARFSLFAVSNHYGGCGGGHYTAFCKHMLKGQWYQFDDDEVSKVDEREVVTEAAYVLFYLKEKPRE